MNINQTTKIINLLIAILMIGSTVSAQSTGYMSPTATAAPNQWTNPTRAFLSDTLWATAPHQSGCHCPYVYLSWNGGVNYTSYFLLGPYGNADSWKLAGGDTNHWNHNWVDTELNNTNFRVKFANSSTLFAQGYSDFNLNIPAGATIDGIEVNVQFHGDSTYTTDYLNTLEVNVFYTATTGISSSSKENKIKVFPNPAHDKITIKTDGLSDMSYSLFSMDGKLVSERSFGNINSQFSYEISTQNIPSGIYLLKIVSGEIIEYRRVSVQ